MSDFILRLRQNARTVFAAGFFCLMYLAYHLSHPKGFSTAVLVQNANEVFSLAMLAMAQTFPVLMAGLDLSVGAIMTLVDCVASYVMTGSPGQLMAGAAMCLGCGACAGLINGCVVVYGRIPPIIATLASSAVYMGLALFLRPTPGGKINEDLNWAMTNSLADMAETFGILEDGKAAWFQPLAWIPVPVVMMVLVVLIVWVPFRRSVTGRTVFAIGSSESAAYMSGLDLNRAKLLAFTLSGLLSAAGGLFLAINTSSGNADIPQAGGYTLNSIASAVIGGASLLGGTGSAIGSIFGTLILSVISFNFRIFDIAPLLQPLFEGLVLLAAVSLGGLHVFRVKNMLELFR
jgi:ribose transport system permease protein